MALSNSGMQLIMKIFVVSTFKIFSWVLSITVEIIFCNHIVSSKIGALTYTLYNESLITAL